jgi:hypothetical protein
MRTKAFTALLVALLAGAVVGVVLVDELVVGI